MGDRTGIEWTDKTWNPWRGCTRVSPGCAQCYMFREQERYGRDPAVVTRAAFSTFTVPRRWNKLGLRYRVFTCSWSDFFHEAADEWRHEAWRIIRETPNLTYQILTKRPERIADHLPEDWGAGYHNVWLGVSGETLTHAIDRGAILSEVPARVHFLSAEPWLENTTTPDGMIPTYKKNLAWSTVPMFDWVIIGGESGPHAREMDMESARQLRDACVLQGIPFFLKQLGGPVGAKRDHEKAVLDGRTWKEMPA
jgi:protein gp37